MKKFKLVFAQCVLGFFGAMCLAVLSTAFGLTFKEGAVFSLVFSLGAVFVGNIFAWAVKIIDEE